MRLPPSIAAWRSPFFWRPRVQSGDGAPTAEEVRQYRADGSLQKRIRRARALGNHRVRPDVAAHAAYRLALARSKSRSPSARRPRHPRPGRACPRRATCACSPCSSPSPTTPPRTPPPRSTPSSSATATRRLPLREPAQLLPALLLRPARAAGRRPSAGTPPPTRARRRADHHRPRGLIREALDSLRRRRPRLLPVRQRRRRRHRLLPRHLDRARQRLGAASGGATRPRFRDELVLARRQARSATTPGSGRPTTGPDRSPRRRHPRDRPRPRPAGLLRLRHQRRPRRRRRRPRHDGRQLGRPQLLQQVPARLAHAGGRLERHRRSFSLEPVARRPRRRPLMPATRAPTPSASTSWSRTGRGRATTPTSPPTAC